MVADVHCCDGDEGRRVVLMVDCWTRFGAEKLEERVGVIVEGGN